MKTLFVFQVQSFTDVVTNSSRELFVYTGTEREIEKLLNNTVPGWENEYCSPVSLDNISKDDLETYMDYAYDSYDWRHWNENITRENSMQTRWAKELGIDPYKLYSNYDKWDPNSKDYKISQLHLRDGWDKLVKAKLPKNLVFVFSRYENPDWDRQEIMMNYGTRCHLG